MSGHYVVCKNSSPDKILNLDHVGTNAALCTAENYLEHLDILTEYSKESGGYPVISFLHDIFSRDIWERVASKINELYNKSGERRK